jgi:polyisoprenoid-binding protein YceI
VILKDTDRAAAKDRLAALPFVPEHLVAFELIELDRPRRNMDMSTGTTTLAGTYLADPIHSSFGFAVKYMGVSTFRATLGKFDARLEAGADGVELTGAADVESISIRAPEQFRAHILSEEFFAADAYPQITFSSNEVILREDGSASVNGALTIKGNSLAIIAHGTWSSPAADPTGKTRSHLALETTINRREFGMTWDAPLPNGGSALADEVTINAELALVAEG